MKNLLFKSFLVIVFAGLLGFSTIEAKAAECYLATGFGGTTWNGTYEDTGTSYDSHAVFSNGSSYLGYANANSRYNLWPTVGNFSGQYYYSNHSGAPIEEPTWNAQGGAPTAGSVATTTCPSAPTSSPTSTIEQTQTNIFYAVVVFILSVVTFLWIIKS